MSLRSRTRIYDALPSLPHIHNIINFPKPLDHIWRASPAWGETCEGFACWTANVCRSQRAGARWGNAGRLIFKECVAW